MTSPTITPDATVDDPERMRARFRFGGQCELRSCRFIDVWEHGAAMELYDIDPSEPLEGLISLERLRTVAAHGGPMRGVVTHRLRTELGRVIVCITFTMLSYQQRLDVNELIGLRGVR